MLGWGVLEVQDYLCLYMFCHFHSGVSSSRKLTAFFFFLRGDIVIISLSADRTGRVLRSRGSWVMQRGNDLQFQMDSQPARQAVCIYNGFSPPPPTPTLHLSIPPTFAFTSPQACCSPLCHQHTHDASEAEHCSLCINDRVAPSRERERERRLRASQGCENRLQDQFEVSLSKWQARIPCSSSCSQHMVNSSIISTFNRKRILV